MKKSTAITTHIVSEGVPKRAGAAASESSTSTLQMVNSTHFTKLTFFSIALPHARGSCCVMQWMLPPP